jgi:opacity protein-like surface antigen
MELHIHSKGDHAMKKLFIMTVAFVFSILSLPVNGVCASNWYVGLELGPQFLTSDDGDNVDNALAYGIYGGYRFDRMLSLEAALTTGEHDVDGGGDLTITSILFGPRLSSQVSKNLVIYGDVGFGIYPIDYERRFYDDSETETGIYLGAGMEFPLQQSIRLGLDFKYHALFDDDTIDSDLVTLMFRVGFDL